MASHPPVPPETEASWYQHPLVRPLLLLGLLYLFLVAVNGLGAGFKALGQDLLDSFFAATENPFMGLMVGILATTLVQSSSVTTASIVGLVAAPLNPLPVANAIPMIMGANIGTTVTNTVASLAHMGRKEEFRRAFAVATCHDFFNYLAVVVLLPLELATGYLGRTATALTEMLSGVGGADFDSPVKNAIKAGGHPLEALAGWIGPTEQWAAIALIVLSGILIFASLMSIVSVMRSAMQSRVEALVSRALGKNAVLAIVVGILATVMVQSSSITTSLLVPLAGAGVLSLKQAFPVTLGANIGTTVTALLAALAATGENAAAGLTIALVHLLFNLSGTVLVYPVPAIRQIPLRAAQGLADLAVKSRTLAIFYVVFLFYLIPAIFAMVNRMMG
ncbi:MAG TPA: Na/Pi symporter [Longimicrobiales bacterium]|nr:Na/Pi symporter [Longimicrobiales bacterium]